MKILFPDISNPKTGKAFFLQRLKKEMENIGVKFVKFPTEKCDLYMDAVHFKWDVKKAEKKVLRLNGVYFDTKKNWKRYNQAISSDAQKADGIVFQSKFSEAMSLKYLKIPNVPCDVIYNGADPRWYANIEPATIPDKHIFITCSRWRPHKRLKEITQSFIKAGVKDSRLIVFGEVEMKFNYWPEKGGFVINYMGKQPQEVIASYLNVAKGLIHLCPFDNCPNSVVEAIAAGVPVIGSEAGGTAELAHLLIPEPGLDTTKPFEPMDVNNPPKININHVAKAIKEIAEGSLFAKGLAEFSQWKVDIRKIAVDYKVFFQKVLDE